MEKVTEEVRNRFEKEKDINFVSCGEAAVYTTVFSVGVEDLSSWTHCGTEEDSEGYDNRYWGASGSWLDQSFDFISSPISQYRY